MSGIPLLDKLLLPTQIRLLLAVNTAGLVEVLLYGLHIVLFCVCMFILARNRRSTQWFIAVSAGILFVLSTADVAITINLLTRDIGAIFDLSKLPPVVRRLGYKNPLFVTNNFIADLILLYRCYMVWGRSKFVLIGASILVLADTLVGYVTMGVSVSLIAAPFTPVYIWTIFGINVVLAIVTVGRIFWVSKRAEPLLGKTHRRGYHMAMAVIIESSVVYSACLLMFIRFPGQNPYRLVVVTTCYRVVAIMPTLLIVQVGLGRAVIDTSNVPTTASGFDVEAHTTNSIVLDTMVLSTQNDYPTTVVNEDSNHSFNDGTLQPLTGLNRSMSRKETKRSSFSENPTTQ